MKTPSFTLFLGLLLVLVTMPSRGASPSYYDFDASQFRSIRGAKIAITNLNASTLSGVFAGSSTNQALLGQPTLPQFHDGSGVSASGAFIGIDSSGNMVQSADYGWGTLGLNASIFGTLTNNITGNSAGSTNLVPGAVTTNITIYGSAARTNLTWVDSGGLHNTNSGSMGSAMDVSQGVLTLKSNATTGIKLDGSTGGQTNTGPLKATSLTLTAGFSAQSASSVANDFTLSGGGAFRGGAWYPSAGQTVGMLGTADTSRINVSSDAGILKNLGASNVFLAGYLSATNGIGDLGTNAAPSNVTVGTTAPDGWISFTNGGLRFFVPAWINH